MFLDQYYYIIEYRKFCCIRRALYKEDGQEKSGCVLYKRFGAECSSDTLTVARYPIGFHHDSMDDNGTGLKIHCFAIHALDINILMHPVLFLL